jgi:hypothetical protein
VFFLLALVPQLCSITMLPTWVSDPLGLLPSEPAQPQLGLPLGTQVRNAFHLDGILIPPIPPTSLSPREL